MEAIHQRLLMRCRSELQSDLGSPDTLLDTLISEGILSRADDDYQMIRALKSPAERTMAFLDLLPKLGPKAYSSFVQGLRIVRPHLADILEKKKAEISESDGKFPPRSPKLALAQRVQESLRKSYRRLAEQTTVLDYGRSTSPKGLHDVYVTVSSLDFDEVQKMRCQENSGRRDETKREDRLDLERRTFASRCRSAKELALRRLLRSDEGKAEDSCLVIGPGGVGKTLLLQWLMVSWAEGGVEELSKFEFVIYVSGRDERALKSATAIEVLQSALKRYVSSDAELEEIGKYLRENSSHLLVLLDSADEGGKAWSQSEGLQMLLERRSLQDCSFIVTSRPCSLAYDLVQLCMLRYYVVGFTDEHLDELLGRRLGTDKGREVAELLKEESKIHLRELMKGTPLVANMVAELAAESVDGLPLTIAQTYCAVSINMLRRQQQKSLSAIVHQRQTSRMTSIDALDDDTRKMFAGLGQMALEGLKKHRFVFNKDDVLQRCGQLALEIGVLEEFKYFSVRDGPCGGVQFRHLSWQECFAAYAVSLVPEEQQDESIQACVDALGVGEERELFWTFATGYAKGRQLQSLMEALHAAYRDQGQSWDESRWLLFTCSCLAESVQQLSLSANQSEDDTLKHVQRAAAAVLPEDMDLSGRIMSIAETKTLSVALENAPHVSKVNVASCGFHEGHVHVLGKTMTHLQFMDMRDNPGLHGADLAALAKSPIARCEKLKKLYLAGCSLDASDCTALGSLLSSLASLTDLNLYLNHIGSIGLATLQEYITKSKLIWLFLNYTGLDGDAGDVLSNVIQNNSNLELLHVADNNFGNTGVEHIMEGVAKSRSLRRLDLSRTGIDDDVLHCVSSALTRRVKYHLLPNAPSCPLIISLHGNCISRPALQHLADQLPNNCKDQLEKESTMIRDGKISQRDYSELFSKLLDEHTKKSSSTVLNLTFQFMDGSAISQLWSLLTERNASSVKSLKLSWNSLGDEGAATLAGAVQDDASLEGLSLNENGIGAVGFSALAESLTKNRSLLFLDLDRNPVFSVTHATAAHDVQTSLHRLVSESSGLRYIGLRFTGLGESECTTVGNALKCHHGNLIFMSLADNEINDEGVTALCNGLQRNSTLKFLDLSSNKITRNGAETIRRCLCCRRKQGLALQRVWMAGNPVSADNMAECMEMGKWTFSSSAHVISRYLQ